MKLVLGKAKSGKTNYIYRELEKLSGNNKDENLILLVPDSITYKTEYDLIHWLKQDGIMDIEVLSFKRLEDKIYESTGNEYEEINEFGKLMILKQIIGEVKGHLKVFKDADIRLGIIKEFSKMIKELKQNLIGIKDMENALGGIENDLLKAKMEDIILVYSSYIEETKDKYIDEEDKLHMIIKNIKNAKYVRDSRIWIDGFESFNKQRLKLIEELSEYSRGVTISLNIDPLYKDETRMAEEMLDTHEGFEAFKITYDIMAEIRGFNPEIVSLDGDGFLSAEMEAVGQGLLSLNYRGFEGETQRVDLYSSMNPYTEVERTAQKIIGLVRDTGYRWRDINIAVGEMEDYLTNFKKVFKRYDIPYFIAEKKEITNNIITKFILSYLDIFICNFKHEDVFKHLKTGLSSLKSNDINNLENHVLQYGIQGDKWFSNYEDNGEEVENYWRKLERGFSREFKRRKDELKSLSTAEDFTYFILNHLENNRVADKINKIIQRLKIGKDYDEASELSQCWNRIVEVFEQIITINGNKKMDIKEYRDLLEIGLKEIKVSVIPPSIDRIEIGNIERIALNRPKVLFVLGVNEGKLDSAKMRGLLLEDEIKLLADMGIGFSNDLDSNYYRNKHILYKLFTSPEDRLHISYSLGNIEGTSLEPSLYMDMFKRIFPRVVEGTDLTIDNQLELISNFGGTYDSLIDNMQKLALGYQVDDIWKDVYLAYRDYGNSMAHDIKSGFKYRNTIEAIDDGLVRGILGQDIYMTVSKLESYASCKFSFYLENILMIRDREVERVEYYHMGNINHRVLEKLINRIIKDASIIDIGEKEEIDKIIDEIADNIFDESSETVRALESNNRNSYLKNKLDRVIKRTAYAIVKQMKHGDFRPAFSELEFGMNSRAKGIEDKITLQPIKIETSYGDVKLRGKIDRVDSLLGEDGNIYISVIDYKSSPRDMDRRLIQAGLQIQLIIYLKAILENGEILFKQKPKIGGVFYLYIHDPVVNGYIGEAENQEERFKSFRLKGMVLKDIHTIRKFDKSLFTIEMCEGKERVLKKSDVIPINFRDERKKDKDNPAYKRNIDYITIKVGDKEKNHYYASNSINRVLDNNEFHSLFEDTMDKVVELIEGILGGDFAINPYRIGEFTPCSYCVYKSICRFDVMTGNRYRSLDDVDTNRTGGE